MQQYCIVRNFFWVFFVEIQTQKYQINNSCFKNVVVLGLTLKLRRRLILTAVSTVQPLI